MIPFLHLGPLTVPTFGLMVATALLVSAYILQADFDRRRVQLGRVPGYQPQKDEGFLVIWRLSSSSTARTDFAGGTFHPPSN